MHNFEATVLLQAYAVETPIRIDAHDMATARQKLARTVAEQTVGGYLEWYDEPTKTSVRLNHDAIVGYQIREIEPPSSQNWVA